jgi:hypothetical protein
MKTYEEVNAQIYIFLASALIGGVWSTLQSGSLLGKRGEQRTIVM